MSTRTRTVHDRRTVLPPGPAVPEPGGALPTRLPTRPVLVLVGGVPGAGKSTAITAVAASRREVTSLDPQRHQAWLGRRLACLPYAAYRPAVHALHYATVALRVLRGPVGPRPPLLVHDPATRPRLRTALALVAAARGWRTVLLLIDCSRPQAVDGQFRRDRVVPPGSFERHWQRWEPLRDAAARGQRCGTLRCWDQVELVPRQAAARRILTLLEPRGPVVGAGPYRARGVG